MRFSTCGRYMATGGADNAIRIWEVRKGYCRGAPGDNIGDNTLY